MSLIKNHTRSEGEPHDRLTRICDAMSRTMAAHPENPKDDIKAIIMISDDVGGGLVTHGFDDDRDTIVTIFGHLEALLATRGQKLAVIPMGTVGGQG